MINKQTNRKRKMKDICKETLREAQERMAEKYDEYYHDSRGSVHNMALYTEDEWCDGKVADDVFRYLEEEAIKHLTTLVAGYNEETYDRIMKIAYLLEKTGDFDLFIENLNDDSFAASMNYFLIRVKRDLRDIKLIAPEFNEILEAY
jgi:hypothetical protein